MLSLYLKTLVLRYKRHQVRIALASIPMKTREDIGITQYEIDQLVADIS